MPTFPTYRGDLPERLNPLNARHYLLLAYWVFFRPTALKYYLYRADSDVYQRGGWSKFLRSLRVPAYRNLYFMVPGSLLLLAALLGLAVALYIVCTLQVHTAPVTGVAVVSGQQAIAASYDGSLKIWDLQRGAPVSTLKGHRRPVTVVTVTPDQRAISGSHDNTLKVWDLKRGKALRTLTGHKRWIAAVALLPENRAISASGDRTLKVWDLQQGKELQTLKGHSDAVTTVAAVPGERAISGSSQGTLKLWDLQQGKELQTLKGHTSSITAIAVLSGDRAISASGDGTLKVWDLKQGKALQTLTGHTDWVTAIAVLPDNRAISASGDGTLKVWDLQQGKALQTLTGHTALVRDVAVLPGERAISASSDGTLKVWDLKQGKELQTLKGHNRPVNALAVVSDRRAISVSFDRMPKFWDLDSGKELPMRWAKSVYKLSSVGFSVVSLLVALSAVFSASLILAIAVITFGVAASAIAGLVIGVVASLIFLAGAVFTDHMVVDPSFQDTFGAVTISLPNLIIAFGIAIGVTVGVAFGVAGRTAFGVAIAVAFILLLGLGVGAMEAIVLKNSAESIMNRVGPGRLAALTVGLGFNQPVLIGASRAFFYPIELGLLALYATFRRLRHPAEWDEMAVLPLPGTGRMLVRHLQQDELDGLRLVADVARNPFQRAFAQRGLQSYLHHHATPLHFIYTLLTCPDLNSYVWAPVTPQDWQVLPSSRKVLLGEVAGQWVDCSSDWTNRPAEGLVWGLTRSLSDRRQTLLTRFAGMLSQLLDAQIIEADDFNLSSYRKVYASLSEYPGGGEIANTFEALAIFLSYNNAIALASGLEVELGIMTADDSDRKEGYPPIRPPVLYAIACLQKIAADVATYLAATSQVNQLTALVRATNALDNLDEYIVAEVATPEQTILRRIVRQWRRLVSKSGGEVIKES